MIPKLSLPLRIFDNLILGHPGKVLLCLLMVVMAGGYKAQDFKLDASSETLILQNDKDLEYSRLIQKRYGHKDYLFLTFAPKEDLFSDTSLQTLAKLKEEIAQLRGVESVVTILDLPLLESPPIPIKELAHRVLTLQSPEIDKSLARIEFKRSPMYQNLFISPDLTITALQINLPRDEIYQDLLERRNRLRLKNASGMLSPAEANEYRDVRKRFRLQHERQRKERHELITNLRTIVAEYRKDNDLFLGGVGMISDDLIGFIKSDLKIFGIGVLCFLVVTLAVIFRRLQWIVLPLICCTVSAISMIGLLGLFGWEVTVISSNFISLQLILTMAIAIHLIVRYRELHALHPEMQQRELVRETVRLKFKPCLYAALTTIAGFGSLVVCDILPVINFGWMMIGGLIVSLLLTFLIIPAGLMLLKKGPPPVIGNQEFSLTALFARFTEIHGIRILVFSGVIFIVSVVGITKLVVENSFIDYFKEDTEIYQGMKIIDQKLGGTTPLDVVVEMAGTQSLPDSQSDSATTDDEEFEEFAELDDAEDDAKYWFTTDKMATILAIHDYLEGLPETGKVLSLGTFLKIAQKINGGKPLDNFMLALLYKELPDRFRKIVLNPYVSVPHNQVRFRIRVRDSDRHLQRNELLKKIQNDLAQKYKLDNRQFHLAGLLVLYNNMLQSLFRSQIVTLGITLLVLMVMFLILFRSVKLAFIAVFPNIVSIAFVLGVMGWFAIPLDMMTITIAAISIGIAVDNAIHYIHRFKQEFAVDRNYLNAMHRCHGSIGKALYYTSITIIMGFSILTLSNFIPSIYFGVLTSMAMLIALTAALTLLPELLIWAKPLGPENAINSNTV